MEATKLKHLGITLSTESSTTYDLDTTKLV